MHTFLFWPFGHVVRSRHMYHVFKNYKRTWTWPRVMPFCFYFHNFKNGNNYRSSFPTFLFVQVNFYGWKWSRHDEDNLHVRQSTWRIILHIWAFSNSFFWHLDRLDTRTAVSNATNPPENAFANPIVSRPGCCRVERGAGAAATEVGTPFSSLHFCLDKTRPWTTGQRTVCSGVTRVLSRTGIRKRSRSLLDQGMG
jgi:hypothetical protein